MAHDTTSGRPLFWRVATGIMYAEMPYGSNIRPPLLSPWESERVERFRSPERRSQWLAGRALAKALVRERLQLQGIVEIREGEGGEPLVYRNGLPMTDVWLSIAVRHGRVAAVVGERPVAIDVQPLHPTAATVARRVLGRSELRGLRKIFRNEMPLAACAGWAVKEAAARALRSGMPLGSIELDAGMGVDVGEVHLQTLAVRVLEDSVVAIVARPLLSEKAVTRVIFTDRESVEPSSRIAATVERSVARARRIAEGRMRWQDGVRPQQT